MRFGCVPQSNGTPRIAAFAPRADEAYGAPIKPKAVRASSSSLGSSGLTLINISSAQKIECRERMRLSDSKQLIKQDMLVCGTHVEGRATKHHTGYAEHPVIRASEAPSLMLVTGLLPSISAAAVAVRRTISCSGGVKLGSCRLTIRQVTPIATPARLFSPFSSSVEEPRRGP